MSKIRRMDLRYYMKLYPTTTILTLLTGVGFIGGLFGLGRDLAFLGLESLSRPWTILTYPFAFNNSPGFAFLSALFAVATLWFIGPTLEGRWSSIGWAFFFIFVTLAVTMWSLIVGFFGNGLTVLYEPWIVLGGAMMLWAWENPELPLLAYGVVPIKGIYLAWIYVAFNFFSLFHSGLLMAYTALVPIGMAWLWLRIAKRRNSRNIIHKKETKNRGHLKRIK